MSETINLPVPFFSQRSNRIKNNNKSVAWDTCNLTSLCMILNYLGITNDTPDSLIGKFLAKKYEKSYEYWEFIKKACVDLYEIDKNLIILAESKFKFEDIDNYIKAGLPIMFSYGILEKNKKISKNKQDTKIEPKNKFGHIAVLRGITENGDWILNDPWGDPTNAWGLLNSENDKVPGIYVARTESADITAGKGSGDNVILSKSEISRVCSNPLSNIMCILWAKQWSFFLRDENGNKIRFGDKDNDAIFFKAKNSIGTNLNFILKDNGALKCGISLSKVKGKKIYSCGPGRIIAIKNTTNSQNNFILVMYSLPENSKEKVFMLYKGLQYVDLNKKIEEGIYNSENFNKTWYDQLIQKIHTKAVIYDNGKASGKVHQTGLAERGMAYLIPQDLMVKEFAEHIKPGKIPTIKECEKINDINNYKNQNGNKISFKIKKTDSAELEIKETEDTKLIPQTVNKKEYHYYRAKLAQLLSNETVVFLGEDEDTVSDISKITATKQDTYKDIFLNAIKDVFENKINYNGTNYKTYLNKITATYQEKFKMAKSNKEIEKISEEFIKNCRYLCKKLLETPWTEQTYAFSYNDNLYKENKNGSFTGIKQVYESIYNLFQNVKVGSNVDFGITWAEFEESVRYFYPANMDFFIETISETVLGEASEYSSIECFSINNIFESKSNMKVLDITKTYNKVEVVSKLKKLDYFPENNFKYLSFNYITKTEVEKFYAENPFIDMDYVLYTTNILKKLSKNKQTKIYDEAIGNFEISEKDKKNRKEISFLLDDKLIALLKKYYKIDFAVKKIYFYNPIKIISYLYELQEEQIKNLKN